MVTVGDVCAEVNNWFRVGEEHGDFRIKDGRLVVGEAVDMSAYLTEEKADQRYLKKGEPITLTDAQKAELKGKTGENGGYYVPSVSDEGVLSFRPTKSGMDAVSSKNIRGPQGVKGDEPKLTATKRDGVLTIYVDGVVLGTVSDGEPGTPGAPGKPGENGVWEGTIEHQMTPANTNVTLNSNEMYVFPEMASLTINLGAATPNVTNEYHFLFGSGSVPTSLVLPYDIKGLGDLKVEPNKTYEISIQNNIGVWLAV